MDPTSLVHALDGARLQKPESDAWGGFFEGAIGVDEVAAAGGALRFDVLIPTSGADIDDFIWRSERMSGTTEKVVLAQRGTGLDGARVVALARETAPEQYRVTFEVPAEAVDLIEPLELRLRVQDHRTGTWADVAYAIGEPVA